MWAVWWILSGSLLMTVFRAHCWRGRAEWREEGPLLNFCSVYVKWVEFDREKLEGKVLALPTREDIDSQIAEHMIVELYSK